MFIARTSRKCFEKEKEVNLFGNLENKENSSSTEKECFVTFCAIPMEGERDVPLGVLAIGNTFVPGIHQRANLVQKELYTLYSKHTFPLTGRQRDKTWFIRRMFRLTSSAIMRVVLELLYVKNQNEDVGGNEVSDSGLSTDGVGQSDSCISDYVDLDVTVDEDEASVDENQTSCSLQNFTPDEVRSTTPLRSRTSASRRKKWRRRPKGSFCELLQKIDIGMPISDDQRMLIWRAMFEKWFMKSIGKMSHVAKGLENEERVREALISRFSPTLLAFHEPGCFARNDQPYIASSADGLVLLQVNDTKILSTVEIKSLTTASSRERYRRRKQKLVEDSKDNPIPIDWNYKDYRALSTKYGTFGENETVYMPSTLFHHFQQR